MNHHLESLGWTLVNFCWQAAAIAFVYWLADAALSKARSQTRYVLALAALLLMLLSALATLAYEETRAQSELSSPGVSSSLPKCGHRIEHLSRSCAVNTTEHGRRYRAAGTASVSISAMAGRRLVAGCGMSFDPDHRRLAAH